MEAITPLQYGACVRFRSGVSCRLFAVKDCCKVVLGHCSPRQQVGKRQSQNHWPLAKNTAAPAISSMRPILLKGVRDTICCIMSGWSLLGRSYRSRSNRQNRVDINAMLSPGGGERFIELDNATFARSVGNRAWATKERVHRPDVDYLALPASVRT